ncbi:RNA exonuclease 4 [Musca vetustissima]|uniref:RNA exonuclease 4 n=1 Tax=Musca vetustissima TaxID=27455 RepID=UPI002AB6A70D|nr:RNA exonuclease 4 [Musca vetustissima]
MERLQVQNSNNVNVSRSAAGSNWEAIRQSHDTSQTGKEHDEVDENDEDAKTETSAALSKSARLRQKRKTNQLNKYLAMDCEMVGVGFNGQEDMLARVSIVNKNGEIIIDKFVKPQEAVTDYRTSVSGIRPHDIENGEEFKDVQDEVVKLLQGKILVGHAIRNDLAVLHIKHPYSHIRDTARYKPLCRLVANGRTPSLKRLSQAILGQEIQTGEHNSVEDARAAMHIYNRLSKDWEAYLRKHQHRKL